MSDRQPDAGVLRVLCCLAVAMFMIGLGAPNAIASNKKESSKEREALRRVQMQLNEARQQKSALEQEKAALSEETEAIRKKAASLESGLSKANARRAALDKEVDALRKDKVEVSEKYEETEKKLQEMTRRHSDATQTLQKVQAEKEQEKRRFEAEASRQSAQIEACETKNIKLYQLGRELMEMNRSRSLLGKVLEAEPFTGLKSVETENLMEEYRDKADAAKIALPPGKLRESARAEH